MKLELTDGQISLLASLVDKQINFLRTSTYGTSQQRAQKIIDLLETYDTLVRPYAEAQEKEAKRR